MEPKSPSKKPIVFILLGLLILALCVGWFFIYPLFTKVEKAQAKVDTTLATASQKITTDILPQIDQGNKQKVQVDVVVHKGMEDVYQAPEAKDSAVGVSAAVQRNLCLLPSLYRAEPVCQSVREDSTGVGPTEGNTGSAPDTP